MSITTFIRTARGLLGLAPGALALLTLATPNAWAALTCSITPANGATTVNTPITFTANTSGSKGQVTYAWTFSGPATPANSTSQSQAVTYSATGTFAVNVAITTTKSGQCSASTNVTVTGGTTNHAPTASNDSYNAVQGTLLSVGAPGVLGNDTDPDAGDTLTAVLQTTTTKGTLTLNSNGSFTYNYTGTGTLPTTDTFTYKAQDNHGALSNTATVTITISAQSANGSPVGRGDTYATPVGTTLTVQASRVSGVLYNDFDTDVNGNNIGNANLTAQLVAGPANGTLTLNTDGSFTYTPNSNLSDNDNDSFTYKARDDQGNLSAVTKVNINILSKQVDFKIFMNYELGMHCTGFEFAYCCVLPPYNSILAQVVKPQTTTLTTGADFPRLLAGDPNNVDGLGRPTVVRDASLDGSGNFNKYYLEYYHDAQPRHEGQGKVQTSTLISNVEGNSMFYTSTKYDSAAVDGSGKLITGQYDGAYGVVQGNGSMNDATDNYANGWLNHFYIYSGLEGGNPANTSLEANKIRLGVTNGTHGVVYPANVGAALQPMGPTGAASGFDNVLTFSGDSGTVVYTQMKVLENLPIMLTSPRIWEALGLPLTPFEDSISFFADPGLVDEDSIRPYVEMKAALHRAVCDGNGQNCTEGAAVIGSNGKPVIGFGTAPIDIPNCERCHSVPSYTNGQPNTNSPAYIRSDFHMPASAVPSYVGASLDAITAAEKNYWDAYYNINTAMGDSDWYSRLKGAAVNMLALHDFDNGTSFTADWPACGNTGQPACASPAQNTRLGHESVICQKCHADNVIAVVKSAYRDPGLTQLIEPITEAIHRRHRETSEGGSIDFADNAGRSGGCQGCHPAHRSDGVMDGYPITYGGRNAQANGDNRLAAGGCFVGRDVHSNPLKDVDGVSTPAHLNAVGQWLSTNVFNNQDGVGGVSGSPTRGLWCTNCHTQLSQEIWKKEDCVDEINSNCVTNPRGAATLDAVASAVGVSTAQAVAWLDPTNTNALGDFTHAIWDPANADANVATIEVNAQNNKCLTAPYTTAAYNSRFGVYVCVKVDADGDPSVRILDWCTTTACVSAAQTVLNGEGHGSTAAAVPFDAATDGRDHWLAAGEPHCADCHAAPFVEPSGGNVNDKDRLGRGEFKPPFNYPHKASLMRYSTGHQGVSCQGCHESIHGLYPVSPTIDATSYAQAAALNYDGSHGPIKCGTCHQVGSDGRPSWIKKGQIFGSNFDAAVTWAHKYTDDASPLDSTCQNCHADRRNSISETSGRWLRHSYVGRVGRQTMDKAEMQMLGHVSGDPAFHNNDPQDIANTVCTNCHSVNGGPSGNFLPLATCSNQTWKQHLVQGRLSPKVWEFISKSENSGSTCGW